MSKDEIEDLVDDSFALPSQYEINEYSMMESFADSIKNEQKQNALYNSLNGKGAFRKFKDKVYNLSLEDEWFKFRDKKYKEIAIEWCKDNKLDFIDDYEIKE